MVLLYIRMINLKNHSFTSLTSRGMSITSQRSEEKKLRYKMTLNLEVST
jgi:hypothetical protein